MAATTELKTLLSDLWDWHLQDAPEFATAASVHDYNDQLQCMTLASYDERRDKCAGYLQRLLGITFSELSAEDRISYRILKEDLTSMTDGYKWRYHSICNPVNFIETIPNDFSSVLIDSMKFNDEKDFEIYLRRLSAIPQQIKEQMELMDEAIKMKTTMHRCSIESAIQQFDELLQKQPEEQEFYEPFKEKLMKKTEITSSCKNELCQKATRIIDGELRRSVQGLKDYLENTYLPNTRSTFGVSGLPDGEEYYRACLRWHLSTDLTPQQVHDIGLKEVARIQEGMRAVMKEVGFGGTLTEFLEHLQNDKQFYFETGDELLKGYKEMLYDFIEPKLGALFRNIPDSKCEIKAMPFPGPGGMCYPPSFDGERPGTFFVNLYYPRTVPSFSMMVLTLHEACPGHHLQGIYALDRNLPQFRRERQEKTYAAPFFWPTYTCYVEGWACYAEYLGLEMGAYRTPYELFGRYSDEMMRATRLVVDTGLHVFGWSRDKAVEYMRSNTCIPPDEIEEDVNRYMMWPGQACGYKIGEIKIRELRKTAEEKLGDQFDIKGFHEVILALGPAPIYVLEDVIMDWIKNKV